MADKLELIYDTVKYNRKKLDSLEEKVDNHILHSTERLVSVEHSVRLRSRIGLAIAAFLPALAGLIYLLLRFVFNA